MTVRLIVVLVLLLISAGCHTSESPRKYTDETSAGVPEWAKHAIWYQIFAERFRNGDETNDPTVDDIVGSWPHLEPESWEPSSWTFDWYRQEEWAEASGEPYYLTVQSRRYGGDLRGVIDKLDYLQDLGVTALYFNPLNDSPSLHKYDAAYYHHIDRNFGPDPQGDTEIMMREDPADPSTWEWTAADRLFLDLIEEVHDRGMHIIMDYSWNHTGMTFWAFRDVVDRQEDSPYADWYQILSFDDPATQEDEFEYQGWAGVRELPELSRVGVPEDPGPHPHPGNLHPDLKEHIFAVTQRWLDPYGDGDLSKGVDGFRLDVAELLPLGFLREYREFVRSISPEAVLIGEIWWDEWPHLLMNPEPWMRGDTFDGIMNYRWYMPTRSYFAETPPIGAASEYAAHIDSVMFDLPSHHVSASMLMAASHDSPRLSTSLYNDGFYKYHANPRDNPDYRLDKPDEATRAVQEMVLINQFTMPGAPHIYYGDEVGMWGPDDPDCRKPMLWPDLDYDDEASDPFGRPREPDSVAPDMALLNFYRQLTSLRRDYTDLFVDGSFEWVAIDDTSHVLAYRRLLDTREAVVIFNRSETRQEVVVPGLENGTFAPGLGYTDTVHTLEGVFRRRVEPMTAEIWISE